MRIGNTACNICQEIIDERQPGMRGVALLNDRRASTKDIRKFSVAKGEEQDLTFIHLCIYCAHGLVKSSSALKIAVAEVLADMAEQMQNEEEVLNSKQK